MPPIETIVETAVYGGDLPALERFYAEVMEFEPIGREAGRHAFFRVGRGSVLLCFDAQAAARPGGLPPHGATGPGHVAFGVRGHELDAWRERLMSLGVEIEAETTWPAGGRSLYFRDPAGNLLELLTPGLWNTPAGW